MANIGEVTFVIYFGTKFDDLNIPFNTGLIRDTATKKIELKGQFVWQTTWIGGITCNVKDYQDIVGGQYVEIIDTGASFAGAHWFSIAAYTQLSQKSVQIDILYDALLSINVAHITGISGILKRWTVDNDAHFNYVFSSEPINQIDDFEYSYQRIEPVTKNVAPVSIVGFPYNMALPPSILTYVNDDGTQTGIQYPDLKPVDRLTFFNSSITTDMGNRALQDGMSYYAWITVDNYPVYRNYCLAMGLGFDLANNAYILPQSELISREQVDAGLHTNITGLSRVYTGNYGIFYDGYNNNKAGDLGLSFSLYNELTGDIVNVENYDLSNTNVKVMVNPYSNGCFMARFSTYQHDNNGLSGLVKSVGYRTFSLSSNVGNGANLNQLNNAMSIDSLMLQSKNQEQTAQLQYDNSVRSNVVGGISSAIGAIGSFMSGDIGGGISQLSGIANIGMEASNNKRELQNTLNIISSNRNQQKQQLSVQGTLGKITPPTFKMANSSVNELDGYCFVLRRCTLSTRDRQRADYFFTAFGYNVDNTLLNNVNQLNARQRFTFVMADDVNIHSVSGNTDLTRLRDFRTMNQIKERFSAGLRIWQIEPDYNFTIKNNIR